MSNSRRGLLAAGLAAAVVGSMGVVWTLNADAAEAPAAVVAPVAAAEPAPVPPALLPWGDVPEPVELAKPGANSAAVAAAGADAAAADKSGSLVPEPEYAPKGYGLESAHTAVPPTPPGMAKAADTKADFYYAGTKQAGDTDGSWANLTIESAKLGTGDIHTLAEIAVSSADLDGDDRRDHAVEVGWHVDPGVNGDSDPHLFVYYWKDDKGQCYNCDFTVYSKTMKPGATLPLNSQKRFGIQHSGGLWWVAYNSEWLGYFPDSLWAGKYTKGASVKWFGEVAVPVGKVPCSDMGNGKRPSDGNAARIGSISMTNGPTVNMEQVELNDYYSMEMAKDPETGADSKTTFRYGGSGGQKKTKAQPNLPC